MSLLLSNLLPVAVAGILLLLISCWRSLAPRKRKCAFWFGVGLIAIAIVGMSVVICGAPGGQITTLEPKRVRHDVVEPAELLTATLRAPWDAESTTDWPAAEMCALISETAYLPAAEAEPKFFATGFAGARIFTDASMSGYVLNVEDCAVVVFRGTDDPADWIINLNRFAARTPHGSVHKGFNDAYRTLRQQIASLLDSSDPKHVWVTGHSLGGALAVLCVYDLIENEKRDVSGLMTFGQPMVASDRFAEYLGGQLAHRFAHFVNESDVVPRIPPSYRHFGSLVWYIDGGIRRSSPGPRTMAGVGDERREIDEDASDEISPLSPIEFRQLKVKLRGDQSPPKVGPTGEPLVQGSTPFIEDHAMTLYLDKIRSFNGKRW